MATTTGTARLDDVAGDVGILLADALGGVDEQQHARCASAMACSVFTTENFSTASRSNRNCSRIYFVQLRIADPFPGFR
jgi:hypothetical protein